MKTIRDYYPQLKTLKDIKLPDVCTGPLGPSLNSFIPEGTTLTAVPPGRIQGHKADIYLPDRNIMLELDMNIDAVLLLPEAKLAELAN